MIYLNSQLNKNIVRRQQVELSINQKGACRGKEHEKSQTSCALFGHLGFFVLLLTQNLLKGENREC